MLQIKDFVVRRQVAEHAQSCRLLALKKKIIPSEAALELIGIVQCRPPTGSGRRHKVILKMYDLNRPIQFRRAYFWCDCEDFTYRAEYVLSRLKSSDLKKALPQPPRETNPRMRPWLCKHCIVVLLAAKKIRT